MKTNVLVVDGGGRGHAIAWKLRQSPRIGTIYVAPGNGGTLRIAENVPTDPTDVEELTRFAKENDVHLTVVGSEEPLAQGIVDEFRAEGLLIFGPTRAAAEIESSKAFAKRLMRDAGIPTAPFQVFRKHYRALNYTRKHGAPIVVKASGLAQGKGAYPCKTLAEAEEALEAIMVERIHGSAGNEVVVEDFLEGPELSIHAFSDGKTHVLLPPAQDHKPIGEGDTGKNTGGMGTIAPVPWVSAEMMQEIDETIVSPLLKALAERERPFTGMLFVNLKMTPDGPTVLEVNCRPGDPETQSYARILKTDLLDVLEACADGTLAEIAVEWYSYSTACIVIASHGYPGPCKKGLPIRGVYESAEVMPGIVVFHAGTVFDGELKTSGGRVVGVSAIGRPLEEAVARANKAAELVEFEGKQWRRDIGAKSIAMAAQSP